MISGLFCGGVAYFALCVVLAIMYGAFIFWMLYLWSHLSVDETVDFEPEPITILIPARNEEEHITNTVKSISNCNYPLDLIQVILIDDFSEDDTVAVASHAAGELNLKVISLSDFYTKDGHNSYKKMGLEKGMEAAKSEYIIMTDADCTVGPDWLSTVYSSNKKYGLSISTGPVLIAREDSLLSAFQSFDFMGTMAMTAAGINTFTFYLANGANLCVRKDVFEGVGGYEGNKNRASGDDVFLMQKIAKSDFTPPSFLKHRDAVVYTEAEHDWKSFFSQRLRWATKTTAYENRRLTMLIGMVFLFCASIVMNVILIPFLGKCMLYVLLFQLSVKAIIDYIYLKHLASYFEKENIMKWFLPSFILHIFYIVIIGISGLFIKEYNWKGRKVR